MISDSGRGWRNYSKHHYCNSCKIELGLDIWRCPKCNRPAKSTPQSAVKNKKYQDMKVRY